MDDPPAHDDRTAAEPEARPPVAPPSTPGDAEEKAAPDLTGADLEPPGGGQEDPVDAARDDGRDKRSARERRAQRVRDSDRRELPKKLAKNAAVAVVAALLLAGGVWAVPKLLDLASRDCQWHEHATFRVFVDGRAVSFQHPKFDMESPRGGQGLLPMRAHLHQPNDYQIHLEGDCASAGEFFEFMDVTLRPGYLELDSILHDGEEYRDDGNRTLRFFLYRPAADPAGGNWTEEQDAAGRQLRDFERLLVTYGNSTAGEVARQQALVPPVASS